MIEVFALGLAYMHGLDLRRLVVLSLGVFAPLAILPLVVMAVVRGGRAFDERPPLFCDGVAAELRAGSSLAGALASAAVSVGLTLPGSRPPGSFTALEVAEAVSREFSGIGAELRATIEAAVRSGAPAADLFDELGSLAIAQAEIAHEVRVSSAPARATAWFFVLAPSVFVYYQTTSGGLGGLLGSPAQRAAVLAGALLFVGGLGSIILLLWRAR